MALGPGGTDAVPAAALAAIDAGGPVVASPAARTLLEELGLACGPIPAGGPPADVTVAALDAEAHRLALADPGRETVPDRDSLRDRAIGAEVAALARVGAELRRECPWDREQTAATIVPHTVEEAFEVAEAVAGGDPARIEDEVGDLLFQSVFLARFLEEDGTGDLASVAAGQVRKLVSRHPHVYGPGGSLETGSPAVRDADAVVDVWEERKRAERADQGIFHDLPPGLPALAYASKTLSRAARGGVPAPGPDEALAALSARVADLAAARDADAVGGVLLAAVAVARALGVDVEIALRSAAADFRREVERAD